MIIFLRSSILYSLSSVLLMMASTIPLCAQGLSSSAQPEILREVGIDQKLNEPLPLDLTFVDEHGQPVRLGDYFGEKPVILSLVYYECPMLCNQILNGLLKSLRTLSFDVGKQFNVITVSFDPAETSALAAEKKETYLAQYARDGPAPLPSSPNDAGRSAEQGWHFLTGDSAAIKTLTQAVGFRYAYDPKTDQFVHASGIMVITPQGRISRYFYGIEYSPRDLRLGLVEASNNKIGSPVDQVLLYCYHYDPITGKYGVVIMNVIRLAGLATITVLGSFMVVMFRRERRVGRAR
jgi:protein SCO1/2